jgi:hypothetical protein
MIIKDVRDKHHKSVAEIRDSDNFVNISSFFNRVEGEQDELQRLRQIYWCIHSLGALHAPVTLRSSMRHRSTVSVLTGFKKLSMSRSTVGLIWTWKASEHIPDQSGAMNHAIKHHRQTLHRYGES